MRRGLLIASVCGLLLGLVRMSGAQNTNSVDIRGTVKDSSGAVVPDVTVTVTNNDTGVSKDFVTDSQGIYDTVATLPGNYTITFSKTDFKKTVHGPISLLVGTVAVDAVLQVGSTTEQVAVTSAKRHPKLAELHEDPSRRLGYRDVQRRSVEPWSRVGD